jgi:phosphoglycolate phosphatase-like HAD superfamily hydrolase
MQISAPCRCVYVGDSTGDIRAALAAGMRAVGVSWGSRTRAELEAAGAVAVADSQSCLVLSVHEQAV